MIMESNQGGAGGRLPELNHLLQHTLRSLCTDSQWVYAVFWRILPRNYPPPQYGLHSRCWYSYCVQQSVGTLERSTCRKDLRPSSPDSLLIIFFSSLRFFILQISALFRVAGGSRRVKQWTGRKAASATGIGDDHHISIFSWPACYLLEIIKMNISRDSWKSCAVARDFSLATDLSWYCWYFIVYWVMLCRIMAWEDGYCNFAACAEAAQQEAARITTTGKVSQFFNGAAAAGAAGSVVDDVSETHQPVMNPDLFFKMSHEVYNYGEGYY